MKVIKRKISLEQFKSRTPSMIDFIDGDKTVHFKSGNTSLNYVYPNGNYNYIPCDLIIDDDYIDNKEEEINIDQKWLTPVLKISGSNIETYSDVIYDSTDSCSAVTCSGTTFAYYVIPYGTLKKMYFFFRKRLLQLWK